MSIRLEIDQADSGSFRYAIWSEPEKGDRHIGRCIGVGATLEEAQDCARDALLDDMQEIDALEEPEENPREKHDDDGTEYADPLDYIREGHE